MLSERWHWMEVSGHLHAPFVSTKLQIMNLEEVISSSREMDDAVARDMSGK
jgi:hypothetical protein